MAATLPRELLYMIAEHLYHNGVSLVAYATVCRLWQPVFESFTFSTLTVHSGNESGGGTNNNRAAPGQKGISLAQFKEATSGSYTMRRAYVQAIQYDILVPFELLDWTTSKEAGYTTNNAILSGWDDSCYHLALEIALLGCQRGRALEPLTWYYPDAGEYRYDYRNGRTKAVPPYRARLASANALPSISCVEKLTFANSRNRMSEYYQHRVDSDEDEEEEEDETAADTRPRNRWHQIWAGAIFAIAQHCVTLEELYVDFNEYVRPDHLQYIKERRAAVAEGLGALPTSIRILEYSGQQEYPWKETMPALSILKTETDTLATNLQIISFVLRELRLSNTALSLDFLWPLDANGEPMITSNSALYHWPYLQVLQLDAMPSILPSGQWLAAPEPADQAEIDNISDWEDEICNVERGYVWRQILDTEQFHRLFISWGYAARQRKMPRIRSMTFYLDNATDLRFTFLVVVGKEGGKAGAAAPGAAAVATLEWETNSPNSYRPDKRVADAWGVELDSLKPGWDDRISATLPQWPPDTAVW
ncbi:hypothetical protein BJY01DRAFT_257110 [Aspergillus pseudoustus]|uniref:F-box domain-containing protein n=1 Tax=Aspergillus pseudoustus TaxID=1810923 RepID=A0ABR4JQ91_9EURO